MRSDVARGFVRVSWLLLLVSFVACVQQVTPPVLTVSPTASTVVAGGASQTFTATLQNGSDTIAWTLSPATGSITAATGPTTTYTPPAFIAAATQVTLTATAGSLSASAIVTVNPAPPSGELPGGADDPVEEAIPDAPLQPRAGDYTEDHPDLPGSLSDVLRLDMACIG